MKSILIVSTKSDYQDNSWLSGIHLIIRKDTDSQEYAWLLKFLRMTHNTFIQEYA